MSESLNCLQQSRKLTLKNGVIIIFKKREMESIESKNETGKRPVFLTVLCILTFISAGIGSLSALFTPLYSEQIIAFIQSSPSYDETDMADAIVVLRAGWSYYLLMFSLAFASLAGAFLMWRLKKIGFHIYALANSAALFVPMLMFSMPMAWSGILLTACFVGLYALNLKYMK